MFVCTRTDTKGSIPDRYRLHHVHQNRFYQQVRVEDLGQRTGNHETHTKTSQICRAALNLEHQIPLAGLRQLERVNNVAPNLARLLPAMSLITAGTDKKRSCAIAR